MEARLQASDRVELLPDDQVKFYEDMGYRGVVRLNGEIVGLSQFIFTCGILVGMDETGYKHRYCYHDANAASAALIRWIIEGGDEPSGYIKRKG